MKTKNLLIIFILFLLITLASWSAVFLTQEKNYPTVSGQPVAEKTQVESMSNRPTDIAISAKEKNVRPKIIEQPQIVNIPAEEKNKVIIIINGAKY